MWCEFEKALRSYGNLADYYCNLGMFDKAVEYALKILKSQHRLEDVEKLALGIILYCSRYYPIRDEILNRVLSDAERFRELLFYKAQYLFDKDPDEALRICKEIEFEFERKDCLYGLIGNIYFIKGDYDEALKYYRKSLDVSKSDIDRAGTLVNMFRIYFRRKEFDKALNLLEEAEKIFENYGNYRGLILVYVNKGEILLSQNRMDEALRFFKRSLEISRETGNLGYEISALKGIGVIYRFKGEFDRAFETLNDALEKAKLLKYDEGVANILYNMGLLYMDVGRYEDALRKLEESLKVRKGIYGKAKTLMLMGVIKNKLNKKDEALKHLKEAKEIFETLKVPEKEEVEELINLIDAEIKPKQSRNH